MPDSVRQPGESTAAFRGRLRRERNKEVDALNLQSGDPIMHKGVVKRFSRVLVDKTGTAYGYIRRATNEETVALESRERDHEEDNERRKRANAEREEFESRPEVQAAQGIRWALEFQLDDVLAAVPGEFLVQVWKRIDNSLRAKRTGA